MGFRVVDGRIELDSDGSTNTLQASAVFKNRINDFLLPGGIEILGYGALFISVTSAESSPIEIGVIVEGHEFRLERSFFPLLDYVVLDENLWIPLYDREVSIVNSLVLNDRLLDSDKVRARSYVELLKLKHSGELDVRLPEDASGILSYSSESTSFPSLKIEPFEYQRKGINWLISLYSERVGGILADQMGLGKTLQFIALTVFAVDNNLSGQGRVLIVVPNNLKENWKAEFKKFASESHQPYVHAGNDRERTLRFLEAQSITLTTYDTLIRDIESLREINWSLILCDEAQSLKNIRTQRRICLASLKADCKFLATGTPVENELLDLWSLMDLVHPGIMGEAKTFQNFFDNNSDDALSMGHAVRPLVLRRRTREVLTELPPEIKTDQIIEGTEDFAFLYEELKQASGNTSSMALLQTLRLFCCYPPLVIKSLGAINDAKADRLLDILDAIASQGDEKVIVFTGFHDSADFLGSFIRRQYPNVSVAIYDGRVKDTLDRDRILKEFSNQSGFAVLIASPRTAGEGLNITSANHVVHYNLDWNPQKENQASARVMRPGQQRTVFIHRLIYRGTVEEYINSKATHKVELANAAMSGAESEADSKSIQEALSMRPLFGYYSEAAVSSPVLPTNVDWSAYSRKDF